MSDTLQKLIANLDAQKRATLATYLQPKPDPIAIIGMACRFPGGIRTPAAFWHALKTGQDSINEVDASRWDKDAFYDPDPDAPGKMNTRHAGLLEDVSLFDSSFFGISPREASRLDPQHRLLLEVTWEALENAGQAVDQLGGSDTGVFIGIMDDRYTHLQLMDEASSVDDPYFLIGSYCNAATGRLSYLFDFQGPSIAMDTACSSSLVALHIGCQSLKNKECELAVVGGVHIVPSPDMLVNLSKMRMLAADGRCKTFDARADGFGLSEGCGIVILKRLSDALANGDQVLALIHGSAVNEDGRSNGMTAPNGLAQQAVIRKALANARIQPHQISYIEAHGSGTALGDPIEIESLQAVLHQERDTNQPLFVSTVKTNLGHLAAASGIAGLMKTVLALQHKEIPPHLHLQSLNPNIDWDHQRSHIPTTLTSWQPINGRRLAGVSSFGWSGTNAHVILEEAPVQLPDTQARRWQLLPLSAKTEPALAQMTQNLAAHLKQHPHLNLADVAYTLQVGRTQLHHRRVAVCQDTAEAIHTLDTADPHALLNGTPLDASPMVTFMFPGVGDQYPNMGAQLYQSEPIFRTAIDQCCQLLHPHLGADLRDYLYTQTELPQATSRLSAPDLQKMLNRDQMRRTSGPALPLPITHLMTFVTEYALAQLWLSWGVKPQALIGYSLGEYVAACLAGVFSLEAALKLVTKRAQLIESLAEGAMLAVALSEEAVQPYLDDTLSLSAVNGPLMCVIGGPVTDVDHLQQTLLAQSIACRPIQNARAFHSSMMRPIVDDFRAMVQAIDLQPPTIKYIANVTGTWIQPTEATSVDYWVSHLMQTVRFADGLQTLWQTPHAILLEVGVGQTLGSLALQHPARRSVTQPIVLSSLPTQYDKQADTALLLRSLGHLWVAGVTIDWASLHTHARRQRCALPTHPFYPERYWINYTSQPAAKPTTPALSAQPSPNGQKKALADWFHIPTWQRKPLLFNQPPPTPAQNWLFFADDQGLGSAVAAHLQQQGHEVIQVQAGQSFQRLDDHTYTINPTASEEYAALIKHLYMVNTPPAHIVHLWSVTPPPAADLNQTRLNQAQDVGFYSLIFLAQALGQQQLTTPIHLSVISSHMQDVLGGDALCPEKATLLGPCKIIPEEYDQITCSSIDIIWSPSQKETIVPQLGTELLSGAPADLVAYRGRSRWVQSIEPVPLPDAASGQARLRAGGVYLITGGFGGLGSALAEYLAKTVQARLVLLGRSPLPPRSEWAALLTADSPNPTLHTRIQQVQKLEALGATVLPAAADVANLSQMQAVITTVHDQWGPINGVFHTAGVPGEGVIQRKQVEQAAAVLAPKVQGTLVLNTVCQDEALDFMVLYSSNIVATGGLGEVDYCAANAFLDAFAYYNQAHHAIPTISINWGLWQWDAWQASALQALPQVYEQIKSLRQTYGITFAEGEAVIGRILGISVPQIMVWTQPIDTTLSVWQSLTSVGFLEQTNADKPTYPRPDLHTPYVPPRTDVERKIADIWAEALVIDKVGIHDHFMELGGNSLLGIVIISRLEKVFDQRLSTAVLYEGPTVSTLAAILQPSEPETTSSSNDTLQRGKMRKERRRKLKKVRTR